MLSRRLVQNLSLSMEAEESMIQKLKVRVERRERRECMNTLLRGFIVLLNTLLLSQPPTHSLSHSHPHSFPPSQHACGYEYTARLQRMVVDMKLSADCMSEFQEHLQTVGMSLPISFSTLVLQSAAWPLHRLSSGFAVPNELVSSIKRVSGSEGGGRGGERRRGKRRKFEVVPVM